MYAQEQIKQQSEIIKADKNTLIKQIANRAELRVLDAIDILEIASHSANVVNSPYVSEINQNMHGIPDYLDNEKRLEFQNILKSYAGFEDMVYVLPNGDVYLAEPYSSQQSLSVSNFGFRDWYIESLKTHLPYLSSIVTSATTGHSISPISVPVFTQNGSLAGILAASLDLEHMQKRIREFSSYSDDRILVIDNNGNLIADSEGINQIGKPLFTNNKIFTRIISDKTGTMTELVNDTKMYLAYTSINAGQNSWYAILMDPYNEAFSSVNLTIYESVTVIISIVMVSSISAYLIQRQFQTQVGLRKLALKSNESLQKSQESLAEARRKIEEQLQKKEETEKLKDEFSAMVSHELRTPLFPIKFHSEMLKDPKLLGVLNSEQIESVDAIYRNASRLEQIIDDVLTSQKLDMEKLRFEIKDIELNKFLEEVIKFNSPLMHAKHIEFTNTNKQNITFRGDSDRLHQIFTNLIVNSVDFVPETNGKIEIGANVLENEIEFYVKDNGIGIAKEKQENLFKKFYQIDTSWKRKHGGTGLGLSICRGIVQGLGGNIWVESDTGLGATFYFKIPRQPKLI